MLNLSGYHATQEIYRSPSTLVLRAVRDDDGRSVIIKTSASERPSLVQLARLLAKRGVPQPLRQRRRVRDVGEENDGGTGGQSLRHRRWLGVLCAEEGTDRPGSRVDTVRHHDGGVWHYACKVTPMLGTIRTRCPFVQQE